MSVVIAIFLILLSLYLIAALTEEFFVPAIDKISEKLKLSSDAAGATLLAMGSSAPEFFIAIIAVFGLAGSGTADVGSGTIVGSAIFNVLVIIGASAMYKAVKLQWQPVIRDMLFYILTIIMLLLTFWDGRITIWEAIAFVAVYAVYVWTVVKWRKWLKYEDNGQTEVLEEKVRKGFGYVTYKALSIFIPDPHKRPRLYMVTFLMSVIVIAGLSWLLVDQVVVIADVFNINPTFLALTVLAAGTSVPDMIGSIIVAKQGRGDMAVSNAIGSNVFNIGIGLGLPWLLVLALGMQDSIVVGTDNLMASIFLLLATVVVIIFLLIIRKWRIGHRSGLVLIALYLAYCVYVIFTI